MRSRRTGFVAAALIAVAAFGATSASAATEFGDNCTGNETTEIEVPVSLFAITAAGDPLPLAAPSAGVLTQWKINQTAVPVPVPQTLEVLRMTGPTSVLVTGESAQTVSGGLNSFNTRIPVQAGDRLGLAAPAKFPLFYCEVPGPENQLALFLTVGTGSTATFEPIEAPARIPVSALIEPDADNDGFGDETQDKCPQSSTAQGPCPAVTLSTTSKVKKALASILVTASSQAQVTVSGTVKPGKGKRVKLNGGTQVVAPGAFARFTLLFPRKLRSALKALPRKRSLTLKVTAAAPNLVGLPSTNILKLKLKGQAKPKK